MASFHCIRCKAELDKSFRACPHCGEPVTDFLRRYLEEPLDGKYRILERLGTGGMGEVYKAEHTYLGAIRVIKVIRPQISESQDAHDRFLREARAATKVQHPNVATLHDFSALPDGAHYMVWEYIDGENLAQRLRTRGTLQPRAAVKLAIQALHGLEAIHRAGIVHRDISPENLMITRDTDTVKIIDLGVAKVADASDAAMTQTGIFVGKLRYASPEHLGFLNEGQRIDGRADLYSLAMVLYEMLTGRPPFEATSPHEYVLLHSRDTTFKPVELPPGMPGGPELQAVLLKALARERNDRYPNAYEFANALETVALALPDPSQMKTYALNDTPIDGDATMRVTPSPDTLHRSTVRTSAPTVATTPRPDVPPPLPVTPPAPPTIRTPLPGGRPAAPQQPLTASAQPLAAPVIEASRPRRDQTGLIVGMFILLMLAMIGLVGTWAWKGFVKPKVTESAVVTPPATTTHPAAPAPVPSATTVDVVPAQDTAPPVTTTTQPPVLAEPVKPETAQTTTTAEPAPKPVQPKPKPQPVVPHEEPKPAPPHEEPVVATGAVFRDGDDTGDNEQAMSSLARNVRGVTRIALDAGAMQSDLANALRSEVPSLTIADSADVVIHFNGTLERLGRGKKRRAAQATVTKNGHVIFRYELPSEEFRVGMTPAEAFAHTVSDAFSGN